jgi:hypothetical protein
LCTAIAACDGTRSPEGVIRLGADGTIWVLIVLGVLSSGKCSVKKGGGFEVVLVHAGFSCVTHRDIDYGKPFTPLSIVAHQKTNFIIKLQDSNGLPVAITEMLLM